MGWYKETSFTTKVTAETLADNADMTLYAKWADPLTLTIDYGNSEIVNISVVPGSVPSIKNPTRNGYVVEGFYEDAEFGTPYDVALPLNANKTIYAKWMQAVASYGTYRGFNLYGTGNDSKTFSGITSYSLNVAADGTCTGDISGHKFSGDSNANICDTRYVYFNAELGILWANYYNDSTTVGTDTKIYFNNNLNIQKIDFVKISNSPSYKFVGKITYNDGTTRLFGGFNNIIYADITIDGCSFDTLTSSTTGYSVYDSNNNLIFSK